MDKFPPKDEELRLQRYETYENIFLGQHVDAFNVKSTDFKKDYGHLRYVAINFGGMLSKLSADMLFEEFPRISVPKDQVKWLSAFMDANNMEVQCYESALEGSYRGDSLFKIRAEDSKLIVEDLNPVSWFPEYDKSNIRKDPTCHTFARKVRLAGIHQVNGNDAYGVLLEKHYKGYIINELWQLEDGTAVAMLPLQEYFPNLEPIEQTGVDNFLVFHIPNFRVNSTFFGISDYMDLLALMFAINNRITKIDNILDKHGDPILAVPKGVLDENGEVRKEAFGLIEVDTDESKGQVPQYIVWDAKLESAFSEIEQLVEFLFMTSETSKSAFGLDKDGMAESGRALKYKLLRTLAKAHRKQKYYAKGLKDLIVTAHKFAKANGLTVDGVKATGEMPVPQIIWQDGIINDMNEIIDAEIKKIDAELTTQAEAVANIDGIDQEDAEKKVEKIKKEVAEKKPTFDASVFKKKTDSEEA